MRIVGKKRQRGKAGRHMQAAGWKGAAGQAGRQAGRQAGTVWSMTFHPPAMSARGPEIMDRQAAARTQVDAVGAPL